MHSKTLFRASAYQEISFATATTITEISKGFGVTSMQGGFTP
jgi:hypothetical protein